MEELAAYDPNLVVGILGGGAGTTYDAFRLIHAGEIRLSVRKSGPTGLG